MRFNPGDLVLIRSDSTIYEMLESTSNVGIVVNKGVLMFVHTYNDGEIKEFWSYDVIFDGRTFRNVPEEVLRGITDENEEDFK